MYKQAKQPVHFVGIGGIGMSGIAEILCRMGFPVSGSDIADSSTIQNLKKIGVRIHIGHHADHLGDARVVVISSAIAANNAEILAAKQRGLPIVPRAEMIAELMRLKYGIAVAGTHGKTTTTSMLGSIAAHCSQDPTIIVGGKVDQLGGNAKLGSGRFLIAEADESDGSFLSLSPVINIITNIDNDHLDHYGNMERLRMAFISFANKVPYYGRNILCLDDPELQKILPLLERPKWTYGFKAEADFSLSDFKAASNDHSVFKIHHQGGLFAEVELPRPGKHNALNATAALLAALEMDIPLKAAIQALAKFAGVGRRFEDRGRLKQPSVRIIDDYGHHPTEITATLASARQVQKPKERLIVAFQPHRYSRTQMCWDQFEESFKLADVIIMADVYAAGEKELPGIDSQSLVKHCNKGNKTDSPKNSRFQYGGSLEQCAALLKNILKKDDLLITLGAGSITQLPTLLLENSSSQD